MCSVDIGLAVGWASTPQSHRFHLFPQLRNQCYPFRPFHRKPKPPYSQKTFDAREWNWWAEARPTAHPTARWNFVIPTQAGIQVCRCGNLSDKTVSWGFCIDLLPWRWRDAGFRADAFGFTTARGMTGFQFADWFEVAKSQRIGLPLSRFKVTALSEKQKIKAVRIYLKQPNFNGSDSRL